MCKNSPGNQPEESEKLKMESIQAPIGFLDKLNEEMAILDCCIDGIVYSVSAPINISSRACFGLSLQRFRVIDMLEQLYEGKFEKEDS